jgi:DNA-binding NarL/FixJ family response regulator
MNETSQREGQRPRILVVDDEENIHLAIRQVLAPEGGRRSMRDGLRSLAATLFATQDSIGDEALYDLTFCRQGEAAVTAVAESLESDRRYAMVFLDMRMPPGRDGLWTACRIRELDDMVNILIMTAFSDVDPAQIAGEVRPPDKLLYLQKPLRPPEIRQFAAALATKWWTETELRTANLQLAAAKNRLQQLLDERTAALASAHYDLREKGELLDRQSAELTESGIAMRVLLKNLAAKVEAPPEDQREVDEMLVMNIKELTEPFLVRLAATELTAEQRECLEIVRANLEKIASPAMLRLFSGETDLTPAELQVANLIRQGKASKDIADLLNLSPRTVEFHRDNIRKKLGISDRRTSLRTVLQNL